VWIPSPSFADFEPIYLGNIDLVDPDRRATADDDDDDADEDEHGDEPEQDNDNTNGTVAAPETCSSRVIAPSPVVTSGLQNAMMGTEVRSRLHLEEKKEEEQEEPLAISPRASKRQCSSMADLHPYQRPRSQRHAAKAVAGMNLNEKSMADDAAVKTRTAACAADTSRSSPRRQLDKVTTVRTGSSRYRGVSWKDSSWEARLHHDGQMLRLGVFTNEVEAAKAWDAAARKVGRDDLNFTPEGRRRSCSSRHAVTSDRSSSSQRRATPMLKTSIGVVRLQDQLYVRWIHGDGQFFTATVTNLCPQRGVTLYYPASWKWEACSEVLPVAEITADRVRVKPTEGANKRSGSYRLG
jgi:hypothetical protein